MSLTTAGSDDPLIEYAENRLASPAWGHRERAARRDANKLHDPQPGIMQRVSALEPRQRLVHLTPLAEWGFANDATMRGPGPEHFLRGWQAAMRNIRGWASNAR